MRVLAVSLRSQLWAAASLVGRSGPRPRRTAAGVGWIKAARARGGAGGADGSLRARVGGPLWAVGGLGLAPSLGMGGRVPGRGLRCQPHRCREPHPGSVTATTAGNMEPPDARAGLLWLALLLAGHSGMNWD